MYILCAEGFDANEKPDLDNRVYLEIPARTSNAEVVLSLLRAGAVPAYDPDFVGKIANHRRGPIKRNPETPGIHKYGVPIRKNNAAM